MTTISAKVIADSFNDVNERRITTLQLRYPRFIHSEFMTHRQFSRNASSSRAIPVERLIQDVIDDTAMPLYWGKNQKGMQASEECNELIEYDYWESLATREEAWEIARHNAIIMARAFANAGYHKQVVNRLLEPFAHINVVVTSTEWSNFFALRDHPDAEPHIAHLAREMKKAMEESCPESLNIGQWHTPYVTEEETSDVPTRIKVSVARCARVSYMTHDGRVPSLLDDLVLYDRLLAGVPLHASPAEHQATPYTFSVFPPETCGNFTDWVQYRKLLPGECQ